MRNTRVLYTENDPALRRVLGEMLSKSAELELIGSFSNTNDTLRRKFIPRTKDLSTLGPKQWQLNRYQPNGQKIVSLGIRLFTW